MILRGAGLVLRPLRRRDEAEWENLRVQNKAWLSRWEASDPDGDGQLPTFGQYVRAQNRAVRLGFSYGWAITEGGPIIGHITASQIAWGPLRSGSLGYWVSEHRAGEGIAPRAVALVSNFALGSLGLHRIEINIRPENVSSLRVVGKLGFRDEGVRKRYMFIDGDWRDHRTFALLAEEAGVLAEFLE